MATVVFTCALAFLLYMINGITCHRKVTYELNPGCNIPECKNITLVHVKAEGENDTLHHLWDFTGKPSLLMALTDKNTSITISWVAFSFGEQQSISFNTTPKYLYSVVIDKLIEFNDENDTGALNESANNSSYISLFDTKNFNWRVVNLTNSSGDATLTIEASQYLDLQSNLHKNGSIRIVVSAYGGEAHSESLPHMLHTGNTSQLDVTIDGLPTQYKNSRFGLQLVTISSDQTNNTVKVESRKTMDDQHAPGIFTVVEMKTVGVACGGYLQWRPVVYVTPAREMTSITKTFQYQAFPSSNPTEVLNATLPYSLVEDLNDMLVTVTNITFGAPGDGFYRNTHYHAWSVLMGYGHPPEEQFSMLVTLVLLIGLGLPSILVIAGTIFIVLRRLQRNKDDFFLSH